MGINFMKRKLEDECNSYSKSKRICQEFHCESDIYPERAISSCEKIAQDDSKHERHHPSHFISFMYKLHLSVWCLFKKYKNQNKFPSLSISFGDSEIDHFKDIVIRHQAKSIHIQIIDDHFIDYNIGYSRLFSKNKTFSLNCYFNSFAKNQICKPFSFIKSIEHLIIYTNLNLDLDKNQMMSDNLRPKLCPLKFAKMNLHNHELIRKFLINDSNPKEAEFYQFSLNEETKNDLFGKLELSSSMLKAARDRRMSDDFLNHIKENFLRKLVFAINQPFSEELRKLLKAELRSTNHSLSVLQKEALRMNFVKSSFWYEFKFLITVLNDIIMHNKVSLNYENNDASNFFIIQYKEKFTFVKIYLESQKVGSKHLFPLKTEKDKSKMYLNNQFLHFIKEYSKNESIKFFIIYTNASLNLSNNNTLKSSNSKEFFCFKQVDIENKRFKILKHLSGINKKNLYQFIQSGITSAHLFQLLCYPKEKDDHITDEEILHLKKLFLHKLIIAANQPNIQSLECIVKDRICKSDIFKDHEVLGEIALRWTESFQLGWMTQNVARQIFDDVRNNRTTYQKLNRKDIAAEIKFTKSIIDKEGSLFNHFLYFVVCGRGKKILEDFQKSGVKLTTISGILHKTGSRGATALEKLHQTCYNDDGAENFYLQTLKKHNIKLSTMCRFLLRAGHSASDSFKNLFYSWFNDDGSKKRCLKILEREKISLVHLSGILNGGGSDVAVSFRNLFDLLFDEHGNKTKYLTLPEKHGLALANFTSVLHFSGCQAANAFKKMYDVLFDEDDNETFYLRILEKNDIKLTIFCPLLHGSGSQAAELFKNVFHLLFDEKGTKTQYLTTLEREGINLVHLTKILGGARSHILKSFKELYELWFDDRGNKTQYLIALETNEIDLQSMTTILYGTGIHAVQAFKNLYHLWIDENGEKSWYLKTLQKHGFHLRTIGYMLYNTRKCASDTYKAMHHILFDNEGNKSERLVRLEKEGITLASICGVLKTSTYQAKTAFDDLYNVWFDEQGNKTRYLRNIEKSGLRLSNILVIIRSSGAPAAKAYKSLHDCWFDEGDDKTTYLKDFEQNELTLLMITRILQNGGRHSAQVFKDVHDLWFDENGEKTLCVRTLEREGIDLMRLAKALRKTGFGAIKCFNNFYEFFFDTDSYPTFSYTIFKANGVSLPSILDIFTRLRQKSYQVIEALYCLFFTKEGEKTQYSRVLENNGIDIKQTINIVRRTNDKATQILMDLYELWFDPSGNKTQHLIDLQRKDLSLVDVTKYLARRGSHAVERFKKL